MPNCVPMVLIIVPMSSEQNNPCAMAPRASIPYLLREISMSFLFKNALNFSIVLCFFLLLTEPSRVFRIIGIHPGTLPFCISA